MNDQIHVTPEKLEAFSDELGRQVSRLKDCMDALGSDLSLLSGTWLDPQFHEFRDQVRQTMRQVEVFNTEAARAQLQLRLDATAARNVAREQIPGR